MALTQVPIELSSTPGIVDNSNATAITIDSSENGGIGSSSPRSYHAPADNLVIGSSGDNGLTIASGTSSGGTICFADGTSGGAQYAGFIDYQHNGNYMRFGTNLGVERLRIDSSGNVEVKGGQELRVYRGDNATYGSMKYLTGSGGLQLNDKNGDGISFVKADGATEYGRFDASGNLLVNRTSVFTTAKMEIQSDAGDASTLALNSIDTDGSILEFYKAGSTVGNINNFSSTEFGLVSEKNLVLTQNTTTERNLVFSSSYFGSFGVDDATIDLGRSVGRFKDLYLSGGAYLGGTAAANKLDDYEEGSWTPVIRRVDGTVAATVIAPAGAANYTKIGNTVNVNAYISSVSAGSSNGSSYWVLYNIPFAAQVIDYTGAVLSYNNTGADAAYVGDAGGNAVLILNAAPYSGSLSGEFMFNITFRVS